MAVGVALAIRSFLTVPTPEQALFVEAPFLLLVAIAAGGVVLIGRGWPRREGERLHCARCGHPWSPEIDKLHSQCQECGAPWRHYGGRVEGRPVRSAWLMGAGVALIAVALTSPAFKTQLRMFSPAGRTTARLTRIVAGAAWQVAKDNWTELASRQLTLQESQTLAAAILDRRLRDGTLPTEMALWMQLQVDLGALPPNLADRWFAEMFEATLEAPGAVAVGDSVPIAVRARFNGPWTNVTNPACVFVEKLDVDGSPAESAQDTTTIPAERFSSGATLLDRTLTAERAGTIRVRVVVWFVLGRLSRVRYGDDGSPEIGAPIYSRRIVLDRDIEVVER